MFKTTVCVKYSLEEEYSLEILIIPKPLPSKKFVLRIFFNSVRSEPMHFVLNSLSVLNNKTLIQIFILFSIHQYINKPNKVLLIPR